MGEVPMRSEVLSRDDPTDHVITPKTTIIRDTIRHVTNKRCVMRADLRS